MNFLVVAALACCTMSGHVRTSSGAPIAGAIVVVSHSATMRTITAPDGSFSLHVDPGARTVTASARGYAQADAGPVDVRKDVAVDIVLDPSDAQRLRPIGTVSVDGRLAIARNTVPSISISRAEMDERGNDRIVDALAEIPSVTFARPDGGASSAPSLVALRGPDPSETLIALDGQILNDANTGDLDVSRFPVAAFRAVDVTEGLGPRDNDGSNTIGGAVNLLSLRPTRDARGAFSFSTGSFGRSEAWYNATGTRGKFGYALAVDNQQEHGLVDQDVLLCADPSCPAPPEPQHLGSTVASRSALTHLIWTFSPRADVGVRVFAMGNVRDESGVLNTPAAPGAQGAGDLFTGTGDASFAQTVRAYDLHSRLPLGAGDLALDLAASNNTVAFSGGAFSPYDGTHQDKRATFSAQWGRSFETSDFAFGGYVRGESLLAQGIDGVQRQAIQSYFLRGSVHPSERLRVNAALYASHYSTFGSNIDGRLGLSYDLDASAALRFSVGTGFRAPLLAERYVFPSADLQPDSNCVLQGQGNPNLNPEHATEYELGYSKTFASRANLDVALYRTNLRDPIENYYPLGATCPGPAVPLTSFPINAGNVVYQGAEVRFVQQFEHLYLRAQYGLNVAYPYNLPATVANPTSGGNLVANAQFLNIPQQVGSLGLDWSNARWHGGLDVTVRGPNNELNRPGFAIFNAGAGKRVSDALDVSLAFTNLTNEAAGRFTLPGLGVPYRGLSTDLLSVEPFGVRFIVTLRK